MLYNEIDAVQFYLLKVVAKITGVLKGSVNLSQVYS
jgi:hypothetical protein